VFHPRTFLIHVHRQEHEIVDDPMNGYAACDSVEFVIFFQTDFSTSCRADNVPSDVQMELDGGDIREPARTLDPPDNTTKLERIRSASPNPNALPPSVLRRQLFIPTPESLTQHLVLDPFIVIPQPGHVHSLAATPCMSYLLTGAEDGYVRAYDFWASANGKNMLSTQQRAMATLGEGVNKGGVIRGYYKNEVEVEEVVGEEEEQPKNTGPALPWMQAAAEASRAKKEVVKIRKIQPVHSLAVQGDGLWALSGTEVSRDGAGKWSILDV
jgi:transcriptional activator SPT8